MRKRSLRHRGVNGPTPPRRRAAPPVDSSTLLTIALERLLTLGTRARLRTHDTSYAMCARESGSASQADGHGTRLNLNSTPQLTQLLNSSTRVALTFSMRRYWTA